MRIPFIGGAYTGRSPAVDTQALINFYIESDPRDNRSPKYAVPTPGLTLVGNIAAGVGRALYSYGGNSLWAVVGNTVYQITSFSPLTTTTVGTLATSTSRVSLVDNGPTNGQQMLAIDGEGNGYVIAATGTQSITGATWTIDSPGTSPTTTTINTSPPGSGHSKQFVLKYNGGDVVPGAGAIVTIVGNVKSPGDFPTEYNGTWTVESVITAGANGSVYCGLLGANATDTGSGGTVTIISGTLVFTLSGAPTFAAGAVVNVAGCVPAAYNGTYTVTSIAGNTFTVKHSVGNPGTFVSGGTVSGASTVTKLTNGTNGWPVNGASAVTFQDTMGIVSVMNTGEFQLSNAEDLTTWPGLDFATAEAYSDNLVSTISDGSRLYLMGSASLEIWYNAGQAIEPFLRIPGSIFTKGCVASRSPAIIDNSVVWLGEAAYGQVQAYQIRGASVPVIISTPQIEWQMGQYNTISDAWSFVYQQDGHEFWVLTFPTAGVTWVWDAHNNEWHQRSSSGGQWLPNTYAFFQGTHYVLDTAGNLYFIDPNNNTENGAAITRTIISPHFYDQNKYVMVNRLEVSTNNASGSGPTSGSMTISWSKDYGTTFTGSTTFNFSASPTQRFYQWRLGRARDWVFQLTTTANPIIVDAYVTIADRTEGAPGQLPQ